MRYNRWLFPMYFLAFMACHDARRQVASSIVSPDSTTLSTKTDSLQTASLPAQIKSRTALYLDSLGLKNIREADSTIVIKLMYATPDNFTGEILYSDLKEAYLHEDALQSLLLAQQRLKERHPEYRLIVYDAARPMSVQRKMWNRVKGTSKNIYVSNPAHGGGLHNYGLAVDVSIIDSNNVVLPMGTEVDYFGAEAHITQEAMLVKNGKISPEERNNRLLLREVMKEAGFRALNSEWWHFNRCSREDALRKYKLIN